MATLKSASLDRKLSRSMTSVYFCKKTKAKSATFYKKESTAFLIYLREVISKFACIPIVTSQWGKESFAVSFTVSLMPYIIEKKKPLIDRCWISAKLQLVLFWFFMRPLQRQHKTETTTRYENKYSTTRFSNTRLILCHQNKDQKSTTKNYNLVKKSSDSWLARK